MPSELRSINDKVTVLQRLAANTISRTSLITYLRENAAILIGTLGADNVGKVVQTLSTYVSIQTHLDSVRNVYKHKIKTAFIQNFYGCLKFSDSKFHSR